MKKALILHGTSASPASNWFGWLKDSLEAEGFQVWLPQLPGCDTPNVDIYNQFLLSKKEFEFDEDTIIVGHSSGAVEALSLLDNLADDNHVKATYLVSAFKNSLGWASLEGLFTHKLDYENIKNRSDRFVFFHSDNDPYCPLDHAEFLADELDGELNLVEGQGHFNTELSVEYSKFPMLLEKIESINLSS